ncbi:MAG: hypothetical protein PWP37_827 [Thermotogota bacterium]|nr:hypothetical protein [Thermotogota bacterium]MDK2864635.1 hypothetical protein [Thermotogota bacterium]
MNGETFRLRNVLLFLLFTGFSVLFFDVVFLSKSFPLDEDVEPLDLWIFDNGVYYRVNRDGNIVGSWSEPPDVKEWVFSDVGWIKVSKSVNRVSEESISIMNELVQLFPDLSSYISDIMISSRVVFAVGRKKIEFADWKVVFEHPKAFLDCVTSDWTNVKLRILNDGSVLKVGWLHE